MTSYCNCKKKYHIRREKISF